MLDVISRKSPDKKWRDKEVRLSACDARVFVEANESAGGVEALVFEDGTCLLNHKLFLQLLRMHRKRKNIIVEVNEHRITFATTTIPVSGYSPVATSPGKFQMFQVTDNWLAERSAGTETKATRQLPNSDKLIIERAKIVDYLLNLEHRVGASKARYFHQFGFSLAMWEQLAEALRAHGQMNEVRRVHETDFGPRYEVEGKLHTPDGRSPLVRSVWQFDNGTVAPRLITAYPLEAR